AWPYLHLRPDFGSRILRMELRIFPEKLFGALVLHHRSLHVYFHNLVAALSRARVQHALLPKPEPLAVMRAVRDLEKRPPIDGGNFDFGAQPRFIDAYGYGDFDVVTFPTEEGVGFDANGDVKVPRRRTHGANVALTRDP